jgi:CheY-like chemotaxis protein
MDKTVLAVQSSRQMRKAKIDSSKRRKKASRLKINMAIDRAKMARMIGQIREEVEFHHGCAAELKARLDNLTSTAYEEILKVRGLKNIIAALKVNTGNRDDSAAAQASTGDGELLPQPEDQKARWKLDLNHELERLLIIEQLLESFLPPPAEKKEPAPELSVSDGAKKILVVDDDPTTVKIISYFLQKENYRVSSSLSGVEGLKKAFKENPDLILLDIMMPDLNGFQFLSIYRKDEENVRIPVVILSSLSEEADVLKGLEIGAADYITKPFSPQVLVAKIKKNINSRP